MDMEDIEAEIMLLEQSAEDDDGAITAELDGAEEFGLHRTLSWWDGVGGDCVRKRGRQRNKLG